MPDTYELKYILTVIRDESNLISKTNGLYQETIKIL